MTDTRATICARCGLPHGKCRAHNSRGLPCGAMPREGADVCRKHGGAAPQVRAKADERAAEARAVLAAARFAQPLDISPADALLAEVARSAGMVAWLQVQIERVAGETPDNLVRGTRGVRRTETLEGTATTTDVGPLVHAWLDMWGRERDRLRKVCEAALRAGVEERRVKLAEQSAEEQGRLMRDLIEDLRNELALTGDQMEQAYAVAERRFLLVQGGAA